MVLVNKVFLACESLLRVPPLLVIDEIFRHSFGLSDLWVMGEGDGGTLWGNESVALDPPPELIGGSILTSLGTYISPLVGSSGLLKGSDMEHTGHYMHLDLGLGDAGSILGDAFKVLKVLALLQLCGAALVCFVLSTKNLVKLYSYLLAFASVYSAYHLQPLDHTHLSWASASLLLPNIVMRSVLAATYFLTRMWPGGYPPQSSSALFGSIFHVLDALMLALFFVTGVIGISPGIFLTAVVLLQSSLWTSLPTLIRYLLDSWEDTKRVRNDYGISHLIQRETGRLRINAVFRLFWLTRAAYDLFLALPTHTLPDAVKIFTMNGTATLLGIIGLTTTISGLAHQIGALLMWILYRGNHTEGDVNRFGSISTVLFFILCLQTSLTSLLPEKRLDRLLKNLVLLSTALLHALHQMVAPLLHAFRTFGPLQVRAVVLSLVFLCAAFCSSIMILRTTVLSTWSMAVIALALEFKIKIIISLLISVFVYFSQRVDTPLLLQRVKARLPIGLVQVVARHSDDVDNDDIIFYLKAFSQTAEFITGIFLLLNAMWIFLFESASAIRFLGMTIHAYFNIWLEGKKGCRVISQRHTASRKIQSLRDASAAQLLNRRDDVCAICYEDMDSAKVTSCGHLFHAVCLRKWLYIQNTCPLCHDILYVEEESPDEGEDAPPGDNSAPRPTAENHGEAHSAAQDRARPTANNPVRTTAHAPQTVAGRSYPGNGAGSVSNNFYDASSSSTPQATWDAFAYLNNSDSDSDNEPLRVPAADRFRLRARRHLSTPQRPAFAGQRSRTLGQTFVSRPSSSSPLTMSWSGTGQRSSSGIQGQRSSPGIQGQRSNSGIQGHRPISGLQSHSEHYLGQGSSHGLSLNRRLEAGSSAASGQRLNLNFPQTRQSEVNLRKTLDLR